MVKAVVGANWGDEGKGKITDMLAQDADVVVRFQGGANAGHTIKNDYGKFALHTLPSGVFSQNTVNVIGSGVALDVTKFFNEVKDITSKGVPMPKIMISDRCQIVMPYHVLFDQYEEERLGKAAFGSTKSGIAPFYSDKFAKIGFQVNELFDDELIKSKLEKALVQKNCLLEHLYHKPLLSVDELFDMGFEAVFIGSGAGLPNFMNIPGEGLKGVYSANEFLTRSNLMKAYRDDPTTPIMKGGKVAVVGGGNVAMDAARTALRLGAEKVYIVYRRSMEELPARKEEVEHAQEEGIDFRLLCNPIEILGYKNEEDPRDPKNGFVTGIRCIKMELGDPDASGRRRPKAIPGSEFELEVDAVVMSIGTSPNPLIKNTTEGLEVNRHGGIIVNEAGLTSREAVYAGGDAVTGAATVISAMGAGKAAAKSIDEYINSKED